MFARHSSKLNCNKGFEVTSCVTLNEHAKDNLLSSIYHYVFEPSGDLRPSLLDSARARHIAILQGARLRQTIHRLLSVPGQFPKRERRFDLRMRRFHHRTLYKV